jgi:hypothetical protein
MTITYAMYICFNIVCAGNHFFKYIIELNNDKKKSLQNVPT